MCMNSHQETANSTINFNQIKPIPFIGINDYKVWYYAEKWNLTLIQYQAGQMVVAYNSKCTKP